jgi:hypothetical protein
MVCPSCTHREISASFVASAVKTQQRVEKVGIKLVATTNRARKRPKTAYLMPNLV